MTVDHQAILHVEDDPALARLIRIVFGGFGFAGEMSTAASVREAREMLLDRDRRRNPFSLIITDMHLPDGSGLDIIREARSSPAWKITPIIVLSGDADEKAVDGAYALGANCYLSKLPRGRNPLETLRNLYRCWLESAQLPSNGAVNRMQAALERAVDLRTRISGFYLQLADAFQNDPQEMDFWLNSAMSEGNLVNLLAFFRSRFAGINMAPTMLNRLEAMQERILERLLNAEEGLRANPAPQPAMACHWGLDLANALDEGVFAEALGSLFPVSPMATQALKARAAAQLQALADHAQRQIQQDAELSRKAGDLSTVARRLVPERVA